jgi:nitrous oxidase accessory protein
VTGEIAVKHWCKGWSLRALALLLALAPVPAGAKAVSLQAQIAAAAPGAVITVPAGVHHTHLRITKPLTLLGAKGAILDGDGQGDVVRIAAPHVTVKNLTIRNSGTDLTVMSAGIFIEKTGADASVIRNRLDHILFGVYLNGPKGTRIVGNHIRGITSLRRSDRGDGVHLWNDTGVLVKGNDIARTRDGIYSYISPGSRIIGNRLHDVRYGIHYMYSYDNVVAGNVSFDNLAGYALMQSKNLKIRNNISRGDRDYGILLNYVIYSEFSGNRISGVHGEVTPDGAAMPGAEGKGIFVYNSEYDRFHHNMVADCPIGIHVTAGSDHDVFFANSFMHNRVQVKYVQNMQEEWSWHGIGNYWSDYLGWDMNGDGVGDVPYRPNDGVDVLLWDYPDAALLMNSPAILALRYVQRAFPVFAAPNVADSHPLMKSPVLRAGKHRGRLYAARG